MSVLFLPDSGSTRWNGSRMTGRIHSSMIIKELVSLRVMLNHLFMPFVRGDSWAFKICTIGNIMILMRL